MPCPIIDIEEDDEGQDNEGGNFIDVEEDDGGEDNEGGAYADEDDERDTDTDTDMSTITYYSDDSSNWGFNNSDWDDDDI